MDPLTAALQIVDYRTKKKQEIQTYLLKAALGDQERAAEMWRLLKAEEEAVAKLRTDIAKLKETRIRSAALVEDAVLGGRSSVESQAIAAQAGIAKEKIRASTDLQVAQLKHQEAVDAALQREEAAAAGLTPQIVTATAGLKTVTDANNAAKGIETALRELSPQLAGMPSGYARNLAIADLRQRAYASLTAGTKDNPGMDPATASRVVSDTLAAQGYRSSAISPSALASQRAEAARKADELAQSNVTEVPGGGASSGSAEFRQMAGPDAISRAAKIGVSQEALPFAEAAAALAKLQIEEPDSVKGLDLAGFMRQAADPNSRASRAIGEMQIAPWETVAAFNDPLIVSGLMDLSRKEASIEARKKALVDTKPPSYMQLEDQARIMYTDLYGTEKMQRVLTQARNTAVPPEPVPPERTPDTENPRLAPVIDVPLPENTKPEIQQNSGNDSLTKPEIQQNSVPPEPESQDIPPVEFIPPKDEEIIFEESPSGSVTYPKLDGILATGKSYDMLTPEDQKQVAEDLTSAANRYKEVHAKAASLPEGPEKEALGREGIYLDTVLHKAVALNPKTFNVPEAPDYIREHAQALEPKTPKEVVADQDVKDTQQGISIATEAAKENPPRTISDWKTVLAKQYGESKLIPSEIAAIYDYARRAKIKPDAAALRSDLMALVGNRRWVYPAVQEQSFALLSAIRALQSAGTLPDLTKR